MWISIEGSIGCGKTTLINKLHKQYGSNKIGIYREPVEQWKQCLELFYSDEKIYSFLMQMRTILSFTKIYNQSKNNELVITERSSYSGMNVFARMLRDTSKMSQIEFDLCTDFVATIQPTKPDYFIYLRTSPSVCYNRIIGRGDPPINGNYLNNLGDYHDQVFNGRGNSYVIDTDNKTKEEVLSEVINIIRVIKLI